MNQRITLKVSGLLMGLLLSMSAVFGQGVTTAAMNGRIVDTDGNALVGATVVATHTPSGSVYGALTREEGYFNLPGLRVGGPYQVRVSYLGYGTQEQEGIYLGLGQTFQLSYRLQDASVSTEEVEIIASRAEVKNGATTNISNEMLSSLPTLSRRLSDFTRLTPQSNGSSFGGQDNRFNNITIDGSVFNNSFGLAGQPGDRTGVSPISLDAIEAVQVNLAPFDVRQAGFTGAGVNAVTRSGTNDISASAYYLFRNDNFLGETARETAVTSGDFQYYQTGLRVGGPLIKDKLFFFLSAEIERETRPATTFEPNDGSQAVTGNISRVLRADLDALSTFMGNNFDFETGPYNNYDFNRKADKLLLRFDYNISPKHKANIRYIYLDSDNDQPVSNSSSLGFGSRQPSVNAFSYSSSNYIINEDINSVVAELNSNLTNTITNSLTVGYTYQNENRGDFIGDQADTKPTFPLIEIQDNGSNYITVGYEPFTPYNQLTYSTFQLSDNLTFFAGKSKITTGFNIERFSFKNVFFPGSQSVYVYNSLDDFYTAANAYLSGATADTSLVDLRRFQLRYSALPGGAEPVQPSKVTYAGVYVQDEIQVNDHFNLTAGIRVDVPFFANTGYLNQEVETLNFINDEGEQVKYSTDKLPDATPLISPRVGFNWNVTDDGSTRLRGGSGIFTGRPAFVWISNQIGNNGVLTGFIQNDNTNAYPFNPDPTTYIPANASAPSTYELALTEEKFKFPQLWRTNLAIEQKLPGSLIGTVEVLINKDVNAVKYYNANLVPATETFAGPDDRPKFTDTRINNQVTSAVVLGNSSQGYGYSLTFQVERPMKNGFYGKLAYNYGVAKNVTDAGSIAVGSWTGNSILNDPNNPDLAFGNNDQRHRIIGVASYQIEYLNFGSTQFSVVYEGRNLGRGSYVFNGDMNGDGAFNNDLIYVPADKSEMNFQEYTASGATFTAAAQADAFEAYINQDPYLSERRGEYAERNGLVLPWLHSLDLSVVQDFSFNAAGKKNTFQVRADIINFTNMISSNWGVRRALNNNRVLIARGTDADGKPLYRFANAGANLLSESFRYTNTLTDVWQLQIGIRYIFN